MLRSPEPTCSGAGPPTAWLGRASSCAVLTTNAPGIVNASESEILSFPAPQDASPAGHSGYKGHLAVPSHHQQNHVLLASGQTEAHTAAVLGNPKEPTGF